MHSPTEPENLQSEARRTHLAAIVALAITLAAPFSASAEGSFSAKLQARAKQGVAVEGVPIHGAELIQRIYAAAQFQPLWTERSVAALTSSIAGIARDGLTPTEYRFEAVDRLLAQQQSGGLSDDQLVSLELLLSEGYIRAVYNLAFGKVDATSLDHDINFTRHFSGQDPAPRLLEGIRTGDIEAVFEAARPQTPRYRNMQDALATYREIESSGGWQSLGTGDTLKPGISDARIAALRTRLAATGDYSEAAPPTDPNLFDDTLEEAVQNYQRRMGIDADGAVGPGTLRELNVSVEDRINQIRVNLERQRWVLHEAHGELIVVDVAGFEVFWVKDLEVLWSEKVQVGKHYTQSPLFKSEIKQVVLNPDWTIPPGIIRRSVIPGLKKNPNYIQDHGFILLTQDGKRVDPSTVDFSSLKGFPYIVRQPPGPDNALGIVKFLFPNPHFVFLHDTNHRDLFDRTSRTFSSGCIRLKNPLDLAERLLAGQDDWTRAKIDEVVASKQTKTINLENPMRIVIDYHTVVVRNGKVRFRPDVYERDGKLLKALNGPFKVRKEDKGSGMGVS